MTTTTVTLQMDAETQRKAEQIFKDLQLTASQAITLFYKEICTERGLPFATKVPNLATQQALDEARNREQLASFETPEALYKDLGI